MLSKIRQLNTKKNNHFQLLQYDSPYKLHIGCGKIKFQGWINLDINKKNTVADLICDATKKLPFDNESCYLIYNEHFLEHLSIDNGNFFLSECYRLLADNGVLRIAMPSLEYIIEKYNSNYWKDQEWLKWSEYQFIETKAEMINIAFRWWGHKWLYDREELHRRLYEAGFKTIRDMEWGKSIIPELCNLETRKDSILICEAKK